jgi:hypothetical protein
VDHYEELPWPSPQAKAKLKEASLVEVCTTTGLYVPISKKSARDYLNYLEKNNYEPYIIFYTDDKTARIEHQNYH